MNYISGNIFAEDFNFHHGIIAYDEGRIISIEFTQDKDSAFSNRYDSEGSDECYIIPGLVDIHSHGCFGHDTCDGNEEGLHIILEFEKKHGITSYMPTTMTLGRDRLINICKNIAKVAESDSTIKGVYLEGPFISYEKRGAQNKDYILAPDINLIDELNNASGSRVRTVAIAPETEGAIEIIKKYSDRYRFFVAHTTADYDTALSAFTNGAKGVTHLYNAMPPFTHRAPGVIGAASDSSQVYVEIISDGIHIHPSVIRNTFKTFKDRVILISDSMEATGMPDGIYSLGGQKVYMNEGKATLEDGTIAGSSTCLFDCLKRAISFGVPIAEAVKAATYTPAVAVGINDICGSIKVGMPADFLVINDKFELKKVFQNGIQIA